MLAASVFGQICFPGRSTVTPVDDDLERVLWAQRRLKSRDEVAAPEWFAGDNTQASRLNCHQLSQQLRL